MTCPLIVSGAKQPVVPSLTCSQTKPSPLSLHVVLSPTVQALSLFELHAKAARRKVVARHTLKHLVFVMASARSNMLSTIVTAHSGANRGGRGQVRDHESGQPRRDIGPRLSWSM